MEISLRKKDYAIFALLALAVIPTLVLIGQVLGLPFPGGPEVLGAITSAILSLVLAVIYWDISRTQDRQLEIQEDQRELLEDQTDIQNNHQKLVEEQIDVQSDQSELMRLQQSPMLSVDDLMYAGNSSFHVKLSNLGDGPATDIGLRGEVYLYKWSKDDYSLHLVESGTVRETELERVREHPDDLTIISKGNYLDRREADVLFAVMPRLEFPEVGGFFPADQFSTEIDNIRRDAAVMVDDQFQSWAGFAMAKKSDYSEEQLQDLMVEVPFDRVRLRLELTFSNPVEEQPVEIDIVAPIQADLTDGEMWEYAMEYSEYDSTKYQAERQGGFDPIGFKISVDEFSENQ